ncbi:MAG: metallophosphoesterase [Phycisphaerales bacterium]
MTTDMANSGSAIASASSAPAAQPVNSGELVFLHISDIHFHYRKSASAHDPDKDLRNELLRDIRKTGSGLGEFAGILIAGDVAFSGVDDEYRMAKEWIDQLRAATGCREDRVWTVPGNHDIDRSAFDKSPGMRDLRSKLRTEPENQLDEALRTKLEDPLYASALFAPLKEYNRFAAPYNCDVSASKPHWEHAVLVLNDGTRLKLRGVTSPLVSDSSDSDKVDAKKLVLGKFQAVCSREDGVEYLVMCHHPPEWLRDGEIVDRTLTSRAHLQLFGHKHSQRVYRKDDSLVIHAGALQPDRSEEGWEPRFNFITLRVDKTATGRSLKVRLFARVWDPKLMLFKPDVDASGNPCHTYDLPLPPESPVAPAPTARDVGQPQQPRSKAPATPSPTTAPPEKNETAVKDRERHLRYRFLSLPHAVRLQIANDFGLIRDEDEGIKDSELWSRILKRAYEGGQSEPLWQKVEERYAALVLNASTSTGSDKTP